MSFWVDPPSMFLSAEAYGRLAPESAQGGLAKAAIAATVAAFWGIGIPLYLNLPWAEPLARRLGYRSGRDVQLNWPVRAKIEHKRPSTRTHATAALIFASYPLLVWLGWDRGRRVRPRSG